MRRQHEPREPKRVADIIEMDADAANENRRRTQAHGRALRHSAQVRLLRRVIPLAAGAGVLAIAGLVFYNPLSGSLPTIDVGPISVTGTKVTMENPRLSGFRKDDRGYEVTASAALQDVRKPSLIELQTMKGHLVTDDKGGRAHIEAKGGLFDSTRESLNLHQDIRLWTDKGEEIRLNSATVDFKLGSVKSTEAVTVTVPSGTLSADSLDVVENGKVISFVGNVRAEFHRQDRPADEAEGGVDRVRTSSAETPETRQ